MSRRTLLVVEDAPSSAAALEMTLDGALGLAVRTMPDGMAAWAFLEGADGEDVCAVITDLHLPVVDGFELIRRIRSSAPHAALPVIVVSATTDLAAPDRALELGANAFFAKPWSVQRLRAKLEQLLYEMDANFGPG